MQILKNRLSKTLDEQQPLEQAAYKNGFSTIDYYMAFVDFEKAFDSIQYKAVFKAIEKQVVKITYINILKETYNDGTIQIKLKKVSRKILILKGSRQGDTLSTAIFISALEEIFKRVEFATGIA